MGDRACGESGGDRRGDKFSRIARWRWAERNRNYSRFIYNALKAIFLLGGRSQV
jgi:hypothetical protein